MSRPPNLCDVCKSMTSTVTGLCALLSPHGFQHHTCQALRTSSEAGCAFCGLVWRELEPFVEVERENLHLSITLTSGLTDLVAANSDGNPLDGLTFDGLRVQNSGGLGDPQLRQLHILVNACATKNDDASKYITNRYDPAASESDDEFQQGNTWLKQCQERHNACPGRGQTKLPTRLLDLKDLNLKQEVRLYTGTENMRGEYVALSYCWGTSTETSITTHHNLRERMRHIPTESLPQTIRDAIWITKKLGFRFLWVDALCILQDDINDKANEIGSMASTYMNAALTIAAGTSMDVKDGFLSGRPLRTKHLPMPLLLPNHQQVTMWVAPRRFVSQTRDPLGSRGWAMQEFQLSPRVLWFGRDELTWYCQLEYALRTNPDTIEVFNLGSLRRLPSHVLGFGERSTRRGSDKNLLWIELVNRYSERQLRFPEDRLPAMSGVVTALAIDWRDKYLAGIWKRYAIHHLNWVTYADRDVILKESDAAGHSPSWSWASHSDRVFMRPLEVVDGELVRCETEPRFVQVPFGQVKSSEMVLNARLIFVTELPPQVRSSLSVKCDYGEHKLTTDMVMVLLGFTDFKGQPVDPATLFVKRVDPIRFKRVGYSLTRSIGRSQWLKVKRSEISLI